MQRPSRRVAGYFLGVIIAIWLAASPAGRAPALAQGIFLEPPIPLTDFAEGETYLGFMGGLYPGGLNQIPLDHVRAGLGPLAQIRPRDVDGNLSANGKVILLSIGMSNTSREFCGQGGDGHLATKCFAWSFIGQAGADLGINHESLVILNGAQAGATDEEWTSTTGTAYTVIRESLFAGEVLSRAQVQVVWLKVAHRRPVTSLPSADADAYHLLAAMGDIVRTLKIEYPNLQIVFVSSRIYAGYATTDLNPEPYAYESGFAVKWLIESQITQLRTGEISPLAGDLGLDVAPWLAWGPYLWADGKTPRSDGLTWSPEDFDPEDLMHPGENAQFKVAGMLMSFFKDSPFAQCWFLPDGDCADTENEGPGSPAGNLIPAKPGQPVERCVQALRAGHCPE